jgi:hypothetical protein
MKTGTVVLGLLILFCAIASAEPNTQSDTPKEHVLACGSRLSVPVYKETNEQSQHVADLPCDETIEVLNLDKDWYRITTKAGAEGYVHRANVGPPIFDVDDARNATFTTTSTMLLVPIEPFPGLHTTCHSPKPFADKLKKLADRALENRFQITKQEVLKLQTAYDKQLHSKTGIQSEDEAKKLEHPLLEAKERLLAVFNVRIERRLPVSAEDSESMFSLALTRPGICYEFSTNLSALRSSVASTQALLDAYMNKSPGSPPPTIISYNGMLFGLLVAEPTESKLEAKPGAQPLQFTRKFVPAHSAGLSQEFIYAISMKYLSGNIPNAQVTEINTTNTKLDDWPQLILSNGIAQNPSWTWQLNAESQFEKAHIKLEAELRVYADEADYLMQKALGKPIPITVPLADFEIVRAESPNRFLEALNLTWHTTVDLFGTIGAFPTVLLIWPSLRKWIWKWFKYPLGWIKATARQTLTAIHRLLHRQPKPETQNAKSATKGQP